VEEKNMVYISARVLSFLLAYPRETTGEPCEFQERERERERKREERLFERDRFFFFLSSCL